MTRQGDDIRAASLRRREGLLLEGFWNLAGADYVPRSRVSRGEFQVFGKDCGSAVFPARALANGFAKAPDA